MSITREESELLEKRETELTVPEQEAIADAWTALDDALRATGVKPPGDDRAARLEAAMVLYVLQAREKTMIDAFCVEHGHLQAWTDPELAKARVRFIQEWRAA